MLQRIVGAGAQQPRAVRGLVLVPTRELAMQVAQAVHRYGRELGAAVLPIYGGQPLHQQRRALERGVDVVVATPGRALDHLRRGTLSFDAVETVVLDEADEMLDMGFAEELDALLAAIPAQRQTALFSATMARRILAIAQRHLHDPVRVTIAAQPAARGEAPRVREVAYVVQRRHKAAALGRVLDMETPSSALVFCRTRTEVDELTETLGARGYDAEALHGGFTQEQRDRVLRRFREGASDVLVATDVAARGLDIEHLSHVVNFDLPASPDAYVHRIGRTGRAGREGVAITLVEPREARLLQNIERATKHRIALETVPTLHDLRARRLEVTRAALVAALDEGELDALSRARRRARRRARPARGRRRRAEARAGRARRRSRRGRRESPRSSSRKAARAARTRDRRRARPAGRTPRTAKRRGCTSASDGSPACARAISSARWPTRQSSTRGRSERSRSPTASRSSSSRERDRRRHRRPAQRDDPRQADAPAPRPRVLTRSAHGRASR